MSTTAQDTESGAVAKMSVPALTAMVVGAGLGRGRGVGRTSLLPCLAVLAAVALTGCASEDSPEPEPSTPSPSASTSDGVVAADLSGKAYTSTALEGRQLVDDTVVLLSFTDGNLTASAGCNKMVGPYSYDGSTLAWNGAPEVTTVECSRAQQEQDEWLEALLGTGVQSEFGDGTLTLTDGEVVLTLNGGQTNRPEETLGRTWRLIGTVEDGATARLPRGTTRPTLSVRADGLARLNTGCNTGRTTVRVEGDQLSFGRATTTRRACSGAVADVEQRLLAVVDGQTTDNVELRDRLLILSSDGSGLLFELDRGTTGR